MHAILILLAWFFSSRIWLALVALVAFAAFTQTLSWTPVFIGAAFLAVAEIASAYLRRRKNSPYQPRVQTRAVRKPRPVPVVEHQRKAMQASSKAEFPELTADLPPKLQGLVMRGMKTKTLE